MSFCCPSLQRKAEEDNRIANLEASKKAKVEANRKRDKERKAEANEMAKKHKKELAEQQKEQAKHQAKQQKELAEQQKEQQAKQQADKIMLQAQRMATELLQKAEKTAQSLISKATLEIHEIQEKVRVAAAQTLPPPPLPPPRPPPQAKKFSRKLGFSQALAPPPALPPKAQATPQTLQALPPAQAQALPQTQTLPPAQALALPLAQAHALPQALAQALPQAMPQALAQALPPQTQAMHGGLFGGAPTPAPSGGIFGGSPGVTFPLAWAPTQVLPSPRRSSPTAPTQALVQSLLATRFVRAQHDRANAERTHIANLRSAEDEAFQQLKLAADEAFVHQFFVSTHPTRSASHSNVEKKASLASVCRGPSGPLPAIWGLSRRFGEARCLRVALLIFV